MVDQSLGSIGHLCNTVVHGTAYVWTEKGPYMFNGSWHPLSPDNLFTVPAVGFVPNRSRGDVDPDSNTYMLVQDDVYLFDYYVGKYISDVLVFDYTTVQPETGGTFAPSRLSLDTQSVVFWNSNENTLYHYLSNKWGVGHLYTLHYSEELVTARAMSNATFFVFQHRRITDPTYTINEAGSEYAVQPTFYVQLGHYYFDDPGGSVMEGKTFKRLWVDARTYKEGSYIHVYVGDDDLPPPGRLTSTYPSWNYWSMSFEVPLHMVGTDTDGEGAISTIHTS